MPDRKPAFSGGQPPVILEVKYAPQGESEVRTECLPVFPENLGAAKNYIDSLKNGGKIKLKSFQFFSPEHE